MQKKWWGSIIIGCLILVSPTPVSAYSLDSSVSAFHSLWTSSSTISILPTNYGISYANTGTDGQYLSMDFPSYLGDAPSESTFTFELDLSNQTSDTEFHMGNKTDVGVQCYFILYWTDPVNRNAHVQATFSYIQHCNTTAISSGLYYMTENTEWMYFAPVSPVYNITVTSSEIITITVNGILLYPVPPTGSVMAVPAWAYSRMVTLVFSKSVTPVIIDARIFTDSPMPVTVYDITYKRELYSNWTIINITAQNIGSKSGLYDSSGRKLSRIWEGEYGYWLESGSMYYCNRTFYAMFYAKDETFIEKVSLTITFSTKTTDPAQQDIYDTILFYTEIVGIVIGGISGVCLIVNKVQKRRKEIPITNEYSMDSMDIYTSAGKLSTSDDCMLIDFKLVCNRPSA